MMARRAVERRDRGGPDDSDRAPAPRHPGADPRHSGRAPHPARAALLDARGRRRAARAAPVPVSGWPRAPVASVDASVPLGWTAPTGAARCAHGTGSTMARNAPPAVGAARTVRPPGVYPLWPVGPATHPGALPGLLPVRA